MAITPEMKEILNRDFDRSLIRKKQSYDYIAHGLVTDRLTEADPDWSSRVLDTFTYTDTATGVLHCSGVLMELTVGGVTRTEAGAVGLPGKFALEVKAAMSDALKRCAMRFGVALSIWEKTSEALDDEDYDPRTRPAHPSPAPAANRAPARAQSAAPTSGGHPVALDSRRTPAQTARITEMGRALDWDAARIAAFAVERIGKRVGEASREEVDVVIAAMMAEVNALASGRPVGSGSAA